MSDAYDVITVGSATVDAFITTDSELVKIKTREHEEDLIAYPSGTKILITDLTFSTGGGGTNTAVSFSRLGLKTGFAGSLGNDENAQKIISLLAKERIDFLGHQVNSQSGYSVILDSIEDDRTILTFKGANTFFSVESLPLQRFKARWFYFCSFVDHAFHELEKLADFAQKNSIKVAFNPSSYLAKQGKGLLANILSKTTALILNTEEAAYLVGTNTPKDTLKELSALGPQTVVVTDGKNPASVLHKGAMYKVLPPPATVVESTGAGDAFGSSFVAGLVMKDDPVYAMKMALINARSVLSWHGAKEKLLTKEAVESIMRDEQFRIEQL